MKSKLISFDLDEDNDYEKQKLSTSEKSIIFIFCCPCLKNSVDILKNIKKANPHSTIVGCSTSGEIFDTTVQDKSISALVIELEKSSFKIVLKKINPGGQSLEAGEYLGNELKGENLKGVFVLSDGLRSNGSTIVQGLRTVLGDDVVISGGLSGDGNNFVDTWIVHEDEIVREHVLAVGFYGTDLCIQSCSKGGWDIFGPERTITRSNGNVLFEIDGKPALELYKEYLGEKAKDLPASGLMFPIQIRENKDSSRKLVRTLLAISEEDQSMTFAGDMPEGSMAQLMSANFNRVINAAGEAAEMISDSKDIVGDSATLAVSCVGRRIILGDRSEEELESLKDALGENSKISGFYSYGEIGPDSEGNPCDLHNQTMTIFRIYEK